MKKWICFVLLLCFCLCVWGCTEDAVSTTAPVVTTADRVPGLMAAGSYAEALSLIEQDPEKYADVYDEVRFYVAQAALENKDYGYAAQLLENVSDDTITLTVLFADVTSQDLPGNQYMLWYYLAAVMNN